LAGGRYRTVNITTGALPERPLLTRGERRSRPMPPSDAAPEGIGLEVADLTEEVAGTMGVEPGGVIVTNVVEGGAADLAGLQRRDVITAAGEFTIGDAAAFDEVVESLDPGDSVVLLIERGGRKTYAVLQR